MRLCLFFLAISCLAMSTKNLKPAAVATPKKASGSQLEVISYKQFDFPDEDYKKIRNHFDISDFALKDNKVYAVSDASDANQVYLVDWGDEKKNGTIQKVFPHQITERYKLQGLAVCDDTYYLCSERKDSLYTLKQNEKPQLTKIDLSKMKVHRSFLTSSEGFKGLAIDCTKKKAYFVNEHEPRFILTYDLEKNKVVEKWDVPEKETLGFFDAKFDKGFLYILIRDSMTILKISAETHVVVKKYSYQNFEKSPGYLFAPASHPLAKAMLITDNEIWLSFLNRGHYPSLQAEKDLGLKGKKPLIVRFQRPEGF